MKETSRICPTCRKKSDGNAKTKPFCSERCQLIDLSNWLDERYVVPDVYSVPPDLQID